MTISEIAKLAGVSNAAVSRYLNHGYLSAEKREAIARVIAETGYRPSVQAQVLRTGKTKTIGIHSPQARLLFHQQRGVRRHRRAGRERLSHPADRHVQ